MEHLPSLVPSERIDCAILLIRGHKVMLDRDLASLYQVPTKALLQAVKRNIARFPEDFMFQLTRKEFDCLTSQFAISKTGLSAYVPRSKLDGTELSR